MLRPIRHGPQELVEFTRKLDPRDMLATLADEQYNELLEAQAALRESEDFAVAARETQTVGAAYPDGGWCNFLPGLSSHTRKPRQVGVVFFALSPKQLRAAARAAEQLRGLPHRTNLTQVARCVSLRCSSHCRQGGGVSPRKPSAQSPSLIRRSLCLPPPLSLSS